MVSRHLWSFPKSLQLRFCQTAKHEQVTYGRIRCREGSLHLWRGSSGCFHTDRESASYQCGSCLRSSNRFHRASLPSYRCLWNRHRMPLYSARCLRRQGRHFWSRDSGYSLPSIPPDSLLPPCKRPSGWCWTWSWTRAQAPSTGSSPGRCSRSHSRGVLSTSGRFHWSASLGAASRHSSLRRNAGNWWRCSCRRVSTLHLRSPCHSRLGRLCCRFGASIGQTRHCRRCRGCPCKSSQGYLWSQLEMKRNRTNQGPVTGRPQGSRGLRSDEEEMKSIKTLTFAEKHDDCMFSLSKPF